MQTLQSPDEMPKAPDDTASNPPPRPWWNADKHADRRRILQSRARIKTAIRGWFESEGFIEIETSCLQVSPGNETHLHAFKTQLIGTDAATSNLYLHTSPEFACKKLLAAGEHKIFTFAPVFRNRERGPLHHPEFTMLEWYRANEPYDAVMEDSANLLTIAADAAHADTYHWHGQTCDPRTPPQHLPVTQAFEQHARIDLAPTITTPNGDRDALQAQATRQGIKTAHDDTWSDIFSRILTEKVEPKLGIGQPTLLHDYPIQEAALARKTQADPSFAERFELYCCGVELANGFGELTDPIEQRARFQDAMTQKQTIYGESYPIDEDFIAALGNMPPASGVALGFDRLVMLASHASHIDQVIWTPLPHAS